MNQPDYIMLHQKVVDISILNIYIIYSLTFKFI